jgi:hypothetical protein
LYSYNNLGGSHDGQTSAQEGGSRKKNKKGLGKKERHEPNLGQVEAREEKEKASDVAHMGEMPDQSQPKRR